MNLQQCDSDWVNWWAAAQCVDNMKMTIWNANMGAPGVAKLGPLGKKSNVFLREAGPTVQKPAWRKPDFSRLTPVRAGDETLINGFDQPHGWRQQQAAVLLQGFVNHGAQLWLQLVARLQVAHHTDWRQRLTRLARWLRNRGSSHLKHQGWSPQPLSPLESFVVHFLSTRLVGKYRFVQFFVEFSPLGPRHAVLVAVGFN